jgi:hypothetical protein
VVPPEGWDHKIPIGAEGDCALEKLTREREGEFKKIKIKRKNIKWYETRTEEEKRRSKDESIKRV